MHDDRLRLLALWHGLRRDVDLLLEPLLAHGPAAVARVSSSLPEIASLLERERAAFAALREACEAHVPDSADDLARGRVRSALARPGWAGELERDATVLQLPDRG